MTDAQKSIKKKKSHFCTNIKNNRDDLERIIFFRIVVNYYSISLSNYKDTGRLRSLPRDGPAAASNQTITNSKESVVKEVYINFLIHSKLNTTIII